MTRDGAISVNLVTGEESHISDRPPEQDYSPSGDSAALTKNVVHRLDDRRISVYRHLAQIRAVSPGGELRHLFVYEPLFLLRDIKLHLNISFPVCHGQPPFCIRVWDIPASRFEFSGKGPENCKISKRVLACCACCLLRTPYFSLCPYYNPNGAIWPDFGKIIAKIKLVQRKDTSRSLSAIASSPFLCYTNGTYTTRERK